MDNSDKVFSQDVIDEFAANLRGELLTPDAGRYNEARSIWNAMVDRKPGVIIECAGAADVIRSVKFARANQLLVSVRGIGHNIAGNSVCDGGVMIDLSKMKAVRVDAGKRRVHVEPGVTLGELDNETQAFGLATPVGINSTTGIAGLTVGGGFGWLSRKHGLTIDNLLAADVVTAEGKLVQVSESENPDLFWGIRGGGGNFGIVTSFEYALHPVGPEILSGLIVHPFAAAGDVLRYYRDFCAQAPDDLTVLAVLRKAPPLPFLPEEAHGTAVVILAAMYAGNDMAAGEKILKPLRGYGNPIADVIGPHTFVGFQAAFDPLLTPGFRNYWKSHDFTELSDEALDTILPAVDTIPSPHCEVFIAQMGGATNRVPEDATAYRHRNTEFIINVHGRWENESDDDRCIGWCRQLFEAMSPYSTGGVYVNFMTEEEEKRVKEAYGNSYDRLVALKNKFDPDNFFRLNQNIRPSV